MIWSLKSRPSLAFGARMEFLVRTGRSALAEAVNEAEGDARAALALDAGAEESGVHVFHLNQAKSQVRPSVVIQAAANFPGTHG
jgi:hypothetical protein